VRRVVLFSLLLLASVIASCHRRQEEPEFVLPPTPVLSVGSDWAVVTSNYLRMRARPAVDAPVVDGLTRGMVVEILGSSERKQTIENETDFWYRINLDGYKGWAFGAYLERMDSRSKAEAYSAELQ
jgi:hypothetical protein